MTVSSTRTRRLQIAVRGAGARRPATGPARTQGVVLSPGILVIVLTRPLGTVRRGRLLRRPVPLPARGWNDRPRRASGSGRAWIDASRAPALLARSRATPRAQTPRPGDRTAASVLPVRGGRRRWRVPEADTLSVVSALPCAGERNGRKPRLRRRTSRCGGSAHHHVEGDSVGLQTMPVAGPMRSVRTPTGWVVGQMLERTIADPLPSGKPVKL